MRDRIYFNAIFGGIGGLIGWMLFGVFGDAGAAGDDFQQLLGGAIIGGLIGYFVVSVDAIRDRSLIGFCRLASYGVLIGGLGGAGGMWVGDQVNFLLVGVVGANREGTATLARILARGIGWMLLGGLVGVSEGIAARSLRKLRYGMLGGALGGFIGGAIFGVVLETQVAAGYAWGQAVGLVILGASIGLLSALVQSVFQPASLRVLRGWQEGREYPLLKQETVLGRDELADVALFRDMKVEKRHAVIRRDGNQFVLMSKAPPEATLVNDQPVDSRRALHHDDRIQLGGIVLRFQSRAATVVRPRSARKVERVANA